MPPSTTADTRPINRSLSLADILNALVDDGRISDADRETVLGKPRTREHSQWHPLEIVADAGLTDLSLNKPLDDNALTHWLAHWAHQDFCHIDPLKVDVQRTTKVMSYAFAQRHKILAVEHAADTVVIASAEPFQNAWEENLRHVLKKDIKRVVADPAAIRRYTVEFYNIAQSVSGATIDQSAASSALGNFEQLLELGGQSGQPDANDQHIVNIVDWLLQYAFDQRASDIHIEPRREVGHVRFRIDGVLHNVYEFPAQVTQAVVARLKSLGRMNVAEKRKPQDGRVKTKNPDGEEVELRLSTLPTAFGEKLVMRVFDPDVLLKSFSKLGFSQEDTERWQYMINQPNGIILVTGPTGSGKTTTLYSSLKSLATPEVNVCTIEDPIEMVEDKFNQMQVQHNIGLSFASGVRALLRQDPDIIMIGEIRDLETAEMAIQAALTGHLVISTLHTNDAPSAITRLMEIGVPAYLIRATVIGVMAQRLVRTLCPHCKQPGEVEAEEWELIVRPWKAPLPDKACLPKGCLECRDTGFLGRMGIYEIMTMEAEIKQYINDSCEIERLRKQAFKNGMKSLRLSGAHKVANGMTTVNEVLRVAPLAED